MALSQKQLMVHLVQGNNRSPYTFVRAKFKPGELFNPWAIQFLNENGQKIPCFVWDSLTWKEAREGRPDWGFRYAPMNHGCGNTPEVKEARQRKIQWAQNHWPELGKTLAEEEKSEKRYGQSLCSVLYLLQYSVPPFEKKRVILRLEKKPKNIPQQWQFNSPPQKLKRKINVQQGDLTFSQLPDEMTVLWKGRKIFQYKGFDAGGISSQQAHCDPRYPWKILVTQGIITKVEIQSQTSGRKGGQMNWQCTYWLFPQGGYVALEGFSLSHPEGYLGGEQKLSLWETPSNPRLIHEPLWETPWWLFQIGDSAFVSLHLFYDLPLTTGYSNNPFTVNPEGGDKSPRVEKLGDRLLALRWFYRLDDPAIFRLFAPSLFYQLHYTYRPPEDYGWRWLSGKQEVFLKGRVLNPPSWMTPQAQQFVEKQLQWVQWHPKTDWLYRQYLVGVGEKATEAEQALRQILGASAGWIDREWSEETLAYFLVQILESQKDLPKGWAGPLQALPYLLTADLSGLYSTLRNSQKLVQALDQQRKSIQTHIAHGGNPIDGATKNEKGELIGEGWIANPAYHACEWPTHLRFLEHFDLPHPSKDYREALRRYADFTLEILGGQPLNLEKIRKSLHSHWPNRFVMILPLMLQAYRLTKEEKYARVATMVFNDLMTMVEKNPHGYWAAWTFEPRSAHTFDTVYNPVGYPRGILAFWCEEFLDLIGREKASRFTAAQARWFVFSRQLLETFETDNETALRATDHGGHPNFRNQIALFLYDDFPFYRGLVGDLIQWAAATPPSSLQHGGWEGGGPYRTLGTIYYYSPLLRWALNIGRETRWFERSIQVLDGPKHFRWLIRNGLPWAQPSDWLYTHEVGLQPSHKVLLWIKMKQPTLRHEGELEVLLQGEKIILRVNCLMHIRFYFPLLKPNWRPEELLLTGKIKQWEKGTDFIEGEAAPGEYQLTRGRKTALPPSRKEEGTLPLFTKVLSTY